ncbi:MAG: integrase [Chitinophagaceae bacterium]|nr:MAG: integrase [Chitinophagaceae bacterium]
MYTVSLHALYHRGKETIAIVAPVSGEINGAIRKLPGVRWSQTHKVWYVPWCRESYNNIRAALQPLAKIDQHQLKAYNDKRKEVEQTLASPQGPAAGQPAPSQGFLRKLPAQTKAWQLSTENLAELNRFIQRLQLKAYSESTIRTYRNEFIQLLHELKNKPVKTVTPDELRRYLVYCFKTQGLKEASLHSRINALKFYFEQLLGQEKFFWEIPRPKKALQLPKLLNEDELGRLFNALKNKKHKAILFTAYSAGLRVSEVVKLKIAHVDSQRMQLFIERAKGKKDRYVNLSPVLLDILRAYLRQCKPRPTVYLFESEMTGTAYPTRTIQQIFSNAKQAAGIRKEVGIHSLRHSFATHLLDKGTDIRYIKDLLGHFDIRTTEKYLHVSKKNLVNIVSPLDDLWKKGNLEW